jgi:hypothetical protein
MAKHWSLLLVLAALWVVVAESQDSVEPLTLLELNGPGTLGSEVMQQVMSKMQQEKMKSSERNDELETQVAVHKADVETAAVSGQAELDDSVEQAGKDEEEDAPVVVDDLKPVVQDGLKVVDAANTENALLAQKLEEANSKAWAVEEAQYEADLEKNILAIKEKFQDERENNPDASSYTAIPFFMFKHLAKEVSAMNANQCEAVCSAQRKCQSYSWDAKNHECFWSVSKITYDDEYRYSAKVHDSTSQEDWSDTPGLKWATPLSRNLFKVSWEECKDNCMKEGASCNAVSYKASTRTCIRSEEALPTDEHATYYEKQESSTDVEEAKEIREERTKLTAEFRAKEAAEKARHKDEQEKRSRETAQKNSAREVFIKQQPTPAEERSMKAKVEAQVQQEKMAIQEKSIKAQEKQALLDQHLQDTAEERSLKTLEKVEARQAHLDSQVSQDQKRLDRNQKKLTERESEAESKTKTLNEDLDAVAHAHKEAMDSLLAFQSIQNSTNPDPEAKNTAKLTMEEKHTTLNGAIQKAEFSHHKEVAVKKIVASLAKREGELSRSLMAAKAAALRQKRLDETAVAREHAGAEGRAKSLAKQKMDAARTSFAALKSREAMQKKVEAAAAGHLAVLEDKISRAPVAAKDDKTQTKAQLEAEATTAEAKVSEAKQQVTSLNKEFQAALKAVMETKLAYKEVLEEKKTKPKPNSAKELKKVEKKLSNGGR